MKSKFKILLLTIVLILYTVIASEKAYGQFIKIPEEMVILNYKLTESTLNILITSKSTESVKTVEINMNELRENIKNFNKINNFNHDEKSEKLNGYLLGIYRALIFPIVDSLKGKQIICFIVDSSLFNVPFHILYDGEKYLLEKYLTFYSTGMDEIKNTINTAPEDYLSLKSENFEKYSDPLGSKIKEKIGIPKIPVISEKSSAYNLNEALNNASALYLSTHGVIDFQSKNYSLLLESKVSKINEVFFSTDNISQFVFLNACHSASSFIVPEFLFKKGTRSFIGSKWEHPSTDRATANIVRRFFRNWKNGMSKLEALIQAQRETLDKEKKANDIDDGYRKNGDYPFYWAAFVLIGDWR